MTEFVSPNNAVISSGESQHFSEFEEIWAVMRSEDLFFPVETLKRLFFGNFYAIRAQT